MKFSISVSPAIVTSSTKDSLIQKITGNRHCSFGNSGNGLCSSFSNTIRVYNIEKHRAKKKYTGRKHDGLNGKVRNTKILKHGHTIAYVYDFDINLLSLVGIKVKQYSRNFKLVDKNGKEYSVSNF